MGLLDRLLGRRDAGRPLASGTRAIAVRGKPRRDGFANVSTGQGGLTDPTANLYWQHEYPQAWTTIDNMLEFDAIIRRIVEREPDDATREGYDIIGIDAGMADTIERYADGPDSLGCTNALTDATKWARAYGGGAIVALVDDGQTADQPLDTASIRRVNGFEVLDRTEIQVASYGRNPNDQRTFNRPRAWTIAGMSGTIHASRVFAVQGERLPRRVMLARGGWGGSTIDLVFRAVMHYETIKRYLPAAVQLMSQGVHTSKYLADAIGAGDQGEVINRLEALSIARGWFGEMAIPDGDTYQVVARSLAGIKDADDGATAYVVGATGMPRIVLLGETPTGLNNGENSGEFRVWYDRLGSVQPRKYTPPMRWMLGMILASREGPTQGVVPSGWGLEWRPPWQLSETEREQLNLLRAQRRQTDVTSSVVSADEVRKDPALVELYGIDPNATAPVVDPSADPAYEMSEDELEMEPIAEADPNSFPLAENPLGPIGSREAAKRLGVSTATLAKMAVRGDLRAWRIGGRYKFAASEIDAYMSRGALRVLPTA